MLTTFPLTFNNDHVKQRVTALVQRRAAEANNATISDYIYIYFLGRSFTIKAICKRHRREKAVCVCVYVCVCVLSEYAVECWGAQECKCH